MSLFQSILSNLKQKIETKQSEQDIIASVCTRVLHTTIGSHQITLREGVLKINAPAMVKMAVTLKQKELKKALFEKGIVVQAIG